MMPHLFLALGLLLPGLALAEEGSVDTNANGAATQWLDVKTDLGQHLTVVHVDVLNVGETITFRHDAGTTLDLQAPNGTVVATGLASGATHNATQVGAYQVRYSADQEDWGIEVSGTTPGMGRVWSRAWHFDAKRFNEASAASTSFYTLVGGGASDREGVVEMKTDGLAGNVYLIAANRVGMRDANGRSVPQSAEFPIVFVEYPVYLNPPQKASYDPLTPTISDVGFEYDSECDQVAQGVTGGVFTFTSNVSGTYHIVCDLDGDGAFDFTSDVDLHLLDETGSVSVRIPWDGVDNNGNPIDAGTYDCEAFITVGEFHYVGGDIETSYLGFRLFEVGSALQRTGLPMYWNDEAVDEHTTTMPNGDRPLVSSGADGLLSGLYDDPPVPATLDGSTVTGNARAWGNFDDNDGTTENPYACGACKTEPVNDICGAGTIDDFYICSKGDWAWLDTYTWLRESVRVEFEVTVGSLLDSDGDGLSDAQEECIYFTDAQSSDSDGDGLSDWDEIMVVGSDPNNPDTDGDGLSDSVEVGPFPENPIDTDGDGVFDWQDVDDDGDGIPTAVEVADAARLGVDDFDGDGKLNWHDTDSDGDGIPDGVDGAGDFDSDGWPNYLDLDADGDTVPDAVEGTTDTDGDGWPDFLDVDDDGDGILTSIEVAQPLEDDGGYYDHDGDGNPDYLDPDDDGDGVPTIFEGGFDDDFDGDDVPNHHDLDSDGDTILDAIEGALGEDGVPPDTDGDGHYDFLDLDSDSDTVPDSVEGTQDTDGDGVPDYRDPDDDGDSIPTAVEVPFGDTDEDGVPDYLDPDDDGDTIPTLIEVQDGAIHGDDVDGDDVLNWHDLDSDGDGVPDEEEGRTDTVGNGVPDYLDPHGRYTTYYSGSCIASTAGGPGGGAAWLVALLAAGLLRRRAGRGALAVALTAGLVAVATPAHALDGPEVTRRVGTPKQVVVLWPRVAPSLGDESVAKMASDVQSRLAKLSGEAAPERSLNVRPRPERVCPRQGGCRAPSVGVVIGHQDGGCAAVAYVAAPGESHARLIPWAGVVDFKTPTVGFREPVESALIVRDFVPCEVLLDTLDAQDKALRDALRADLRAAGS